MLVSSSSSPTEFSIRVGSPGWDVEGVDTGPKYLPGPRRQDVFDGDGRRSISVEDQLGGRAAEVGVPKL